MYVLVFLEQYLRVQIIFLFLFILYLNNVNSLLFNFEKYFFVRKTLGFTDCQNICLKILIPQSIIVSLISFQCI